MTWEEYKAAEWDKARELEDWDGGSKLEDWDVS